MCVGWSRAVLRSVRTVVGVVSHAHVQLRILTDNLGNSVPEVIS